MYCVVSITLSLRDMGMRLLRFFGGASQNLSEKAVGGVCALGDAPTILRSTSHVDGPVTLSVPKLQYHREICTSSGPLLSEFRDYDLNLPLSS